MRENCILSNLKDVVLLKIPYPTEDSGLNRVAHMYICIKVENEQVYYAKCQSYEPYHAKKGSLPKYRVIEPADESRNPFKRKTIVDLDKLFVTDKNRILNKIGEVSELLLDEILHEVDTMKNGEIEMVRL